MVATKSRKKQVGPPSHEGAERKNLDINLQYEGQAKTRLREAISAAGSSYEDLAKNLGKMGVEISARGLENKISRGGFSAAFMLQCLDALER